MTEFPFTQVDVFTHTPLMGNPLAVVRNADAMSEADMTAFANWTNLSETAFLLQPTTPQADYRVRIFTPKREMPFAGHPTLGSCHVWLAGGGKMRGQEIVQECGLGLIRLRRAGGRLAFAAPAAKQRAVPPQFITQIAASLRILPAAIKAARWVSEAPSWVAVLLESGAAVRALKPDFIAMGNLEIGVIGPGAEGADFEVRAFAPVDGIPEDPVTGSLNAALAQWLIGEGKAPASYIAAQGGNVGRAGRIYIEQEGDDIWVGGDVVSCISGTLSL